VLARELAFYSEALPLLQRMCKPGFRVAQSIVGSPLGKHTARALNKKEFSKLKCLLVRTCDNLLRSIREQLAKTEPNINGRRVLIFIVELNPGDLNQKLDTHAFDMHCALFVVEVLADSSRNCNLFCCFVYIGLLIFYFF
jgi:hypothetical protein